jgi:hypothetical protein
VFLKRDDGCPAKKKQQKKSLLANVFSWKKNGQRFLKNYMLHFCAMCEHTMAEKKQKN